MLSQLHHYEILRAIKFWLFLIIVGFCFATQSTSAESVKPDTLEFVRQFTTANEFYVGERRLQDYGQAFQWYSRVLEYEPGTNHARLKLALEQKSVAYERLAHMLNMGLGTQQNKEQALSLYKRSLILFQQLQMYTGVAASNPVLDKKLEQVKKRISKLEQDLNLNKTSSVQGFEFNLSSVKGLANSGNLEAQNELGDYYYGNNKKFVNMSTAIKWYEKAAAQNHSSAIFSLGYIYELGKGVPVDKEKGESYFLRLGSKQHMSEIILAHLYETGRGREKNLDYALELYKKLPADIAAGDVARVERKITTGTAIIDSASNRIRNDKYEKPNSPKDLILIRNICFSVFVILLAWAIFCNFRTPVRVASTTRTSTKNTFKAKDQTVSAARILIDVGDHDQAREMLLAHLQEHPGDKRARILLQQTVTVH